VIARGSRPATNGQRDETQIEPALGSIADDVVVTEFACAGGSPGERAMYACTSALAA
jgi:hypothetical protein